MDINRIRLSADAPHSDDELRWDAKGERYVISEGFFRDQFDSVYRDDRELRRRLEKNSRKVYAYLLGRCHSSNSDFVLKAINGTSEGRLFIRDLLLEQMEADTKTAFNDVSSMPGVVPEGSRIARSDLRDNYVSVDTEVAADNCLAYFGFNLLAKMPFPYLLRRRIAEL